MAVVDAWRRTSDEDLMRPAVRGFLGDGPESQH
jgi:hypothetical protein